MKRLTIWLVRKIDPAALILWNLDTFEYRTIRDFMVRRNYEREYTKQ